MTSYYSYQEGNPFEQQLQDCELDYKKSHMKEIEQKYAFRGGLNIPSIYHTAVHESLAKKESGWRDGVEYTFRPAACHAPGLYQPRMTVNIPQRPWDDDCFIQQQSRLNDVAYQYTQNLDKFRRRGVEIPPTAGAGIRADRTAALYPGQARSDFYMKGRGIRLSRCGGEIPNIPPDPRDRLFNRKRADSGLYPAATTNRRGMVATHEIDPVQRLGLTAKGPSVGGYAALWQRDGFLVDSYQEAVDEQDRLNEQLWCTEPSYY